MKQRAQLNERLHVASQLERHDIAALASEGIKSLISNRPDGEEPGQLSFADVATEAQRVGIHTRHIPVTAGTMPSADQIAEFARALAELPAPIMAFCRTGTRSTTIWTLSQAKHTDAPTLIEAAKRAGYDLSRLEEQLRRLRTT